MYVCGLMWSDCHLIVVLTHLGGRALLDLSVELLAVLRSLWMRCPRARLHKCIRDEFPSPPNTKVMTSEEPAEQAKEGGYTMFPLRKERYDPICVTVKINNAPLLMEVDTGASLTVISEATYQTTCGDQATQPHKFKVKLKHMQDRRYQ